MSEGTPPVFIPSRNLPDQGEDGSPFTVRELCTAAEKTSGYNTIIGAQRIGGLWRIYPKNMDSRVALLLNGIEVRNASVSLFDKNPFIVRTNNGEQEIPTTKLVIGNLPISYCNTDIEKKLTQMGCNLRSKLLMERDRDEKGGLTRWLTGRRFVYIQIPDRPLPDKINIGPATATLYHREQKMNTENTTCTRCLTKGHRAATCTNDVVCRTCSRPGHKRGHPSCPLQVSSQSGQSGPEPPSRFDSVPSTSSVLSCVPPLEPVLPSSDSAEPTTPLPTSTPAASSPAPGSRMMPPPQRGRPLTQSTLDLRGRARSSSTKRHHSSPSSGRDGKVARTSPESPTATDPPATDVGTGTEVSTPPPPPVETNPS